MHFNAFSMHAGFVPTFSQINVKTACYFSKLSASWRHFLVYYTYPRLVIVTDTLRATVLGDVHYCSPTANEE